MIYYVKEKTFEVVTKLMEIQSLLISSKARIIELEYEKKQKDKWELESTKYELFKTEAGSLLYRIKSSEQCYQSEIYLYPHCYEERKNRYFSRLLEKQLRGIIKVTVLLVKINKAWIRK